MYFIDFHHPNAELNTSFLEFIKRKYSYMSIKITDLTKLDKIIKELFFNCLIENVPRYKTDKNMINYYITQFSERVAANLVGLECAYINDRLRSNSDYAIQQSDYLISQLEIDTKQFIRSKYQSVTL